MFEEENFEQQGFGPSKCAQLLSETNSPKIHPKNDMVNNTRKFERFGQTVNYYLNVARAHVLSLKYGPLSNSGLE